MSILNFIEKRKDEKFIRSVIKNGDSRALYGIRYPSLSKFDKEVDIFAAYTFVLIGNYFDVKSRECKDIKDLLTRVVNKIDIPKDKLTPIKIIPLAFLNWLNETAIPKIIDHLRYYHLNPDIFYGSLQRARFINRMLYYSIKNDRDKDYIRFAIIFGIDQFNKLINEVIEDNKFEVGKGANIFIEPESAGVVH